MTRPKSYAKKRGKTTTSRSSAPSRSDKRQRQKWSRSEIDRLKRLYPKYSNQDIAHRLGRSLSSVISQAFKMGLKKSPERLVQMGQENIAHRWGQKRQTQRK